MDTLPASHSPARAWHAVALLILLYSFSFVDRYVIGLLTAPLGSDLGVSDVDFGILLGAGFAVIYSLVGLPIAGWVDRGPRCRILVGSTLIWSAMTILSAFAQTYPQFLYCRLGLAVAEAALTPAAISLIGDLFQRERRVLPTSLYVSVPSFMVTGALIVGAAALQLSKSLQPMLGLAPWRTTLVLCGLPGIALSILFFLTVREPLRVSRSGQDIEREKIAAGNKRDFVAFLAKNVRFFVPFYAGVGLIFMYVMALAAWMPTILIRGYRLNAETAGYLLGVCGLPATLMGTLLWPDVVSVLERRGRPFAIFYCLIAVIGAATPFFVYSPIAASAPLVLACFAVAKLALPNSTIMPPLALQNYAPAQFRGRLIAVHLMMVNIVGFTIGPVAVPMLALLWPNEATALGRGLSLLSAVAIPTSVILFYLSRRALSPKQLAAVPAEAVGA